MNTYYKFAPNVFLAKCTEQHEKFDIIPVTTKYGKENECIVYNLIWEKKGFFFYSIVRADGFDQQERAKRKAEKLIAASTNADNKSDQYYQASKEGREFLSLGEPIKVGHHSEKRHRALFERNDNRMRKCIEYTDKAKEYANRAEYWKHKAGQINLSMPESLEYYEHLLEKARAKHEGLKNGTIKREHSFSLTYAKKEVNEIKKKLDIAQKLWG
jgi:hypothetical protein